MTINRVGGEQLLLGTRQRQRGRRISTPEEQLDQQLGRLAVAKADFKNP